MNTQDTQNMEKNLIRIRFWSCPSESSVSSVSKLLIQRS